MGHSGHVLFSIRIVVASLILGGMFLIANETYGRALLRFYFWEIHQIAPTYKILRLEVSSPHDGWKITMVARINEYLFVRGRLHPPGDFVLETSSTLGWAMIDSVLVFIPPLAWPSPTVARRCLAVLLAAIAFVLVEAIDIPLILVGSIDRGLAEISGRAEPPLGAWGEIVTGGGDVAVSLVAGLLAVVIAFGSSRGLKSFRKGPGGAVLKLTGNAASAPERHAPSNQ